MRSPAQAYVEERAGEQGEDDKWRSQMAKQLAQMQAALKAQATTLASIMDKLGTVQASSQSLPPAPICEQSGWLYKRSNVRRRTRTADSL